MERGGRSGTSKEVVHSERKASSRRVECTQTLGEGSTETSGRFVELDLETHPRQAEKGMIDRAKSAGVSIFQGGQKVAELSKDTEAITVPAKESIVVLSGSSAKFDGEPLPLIRTGAGSVASLDLSRSAGFHLLETADHARYWLATEDGKLKATEILRMLELLETLGLSWGGQLFFSDGSGLQLIEVIGRRRWCVFGTRRDRDRDPHRRHRLQDLLRRR